MRRVLTVLLAGIAVLAAGCADDPPPAPPEVTFSVGGASVAVKPTQYCERDTNSCANDAGATGSLRVPAGQPVRISVPEQVSSAPWVAVFRYRTAAGAVGEPGRSSVFPPGSTTEYTLDLPEPDAVLEEVQVQRIGNIGKGETVGEGLTYLADATWVLTATR